MTRFESVSMRSPVLSKSLTISQLFSTDCAFKFFFHVHVLALKVAIQLVLGNKVSITDFAGALGHVRHDRQNRRCCVIDYVIGYRR